jgi:hypothetical protein
MRTAITSVLSLTVLLAAASVRADDDVCTVDGKPLEGWDCYLEDANVALEDVWSTEDGMLKCTGTPIGYIHTKQKFKNFQLTLEWRWAPGTKPGNNGALLRIDGDAVTFLPKCIECQLKSGDAGSVYGFHGFSLKGDADRSGGGDNEKLGKFVSVKKKIEGAEKEPGQWNKYDITLSGGDLTVKVNGKLVNQATDCDEIAGYIGLQSEGGEIHFRNICIKTLP